ncbi:hypothetical protein I6F07_16670 [Ensifer sp. IC4062]|nr:hypothetical protein [Ensifer sp. IC4062]
MQALGAFSYVEPFIGAVLVAVFTGAAVSWSLLWSGLLVVTGAVIASASLWDLWKRRQNSDRSGVPTAGHRTAWLASVADISSETDLRRVANLMLERLVQLAQDYGDPRKHEDEIRELLQSLRIIVEIWDELQVVDPCCAEAGKYGPDLEIA